MDSFQESSSAVIDADDKAFYEELARQILMLTDEDDYEKGVYNGSAKIRRMPMVYGGGVGSGLTAKNYYSWCEPGTYPVPSWMESLWANGGGGGTGVFIPSGVVATRRGKKSGRRRYNKSKATKNNDKGRVYSPVVQKIHG